jgi:hypothetical protein
VEAVRPMDATIIAAVITGICALAAAGIPIVLSHRRDRQPGADDREIGLTREQILERLERHRQRATYGAVAGLLGRDPQTLFNGCGFSTRNSWVVSAANGEPTKYRRSQMHPDLFQNGHVIRTTQELRLWLESHP